MSSSARRLHILTGCTAVGKTELAVAWAERHEAEIVSCDSLLFYRGMDIGTAKPERALRERVPHHLIDIRDPADPMDIKSYLGLVQTVVEDLDRRGRAILVTGGSGFYLQSFLRPVADAVEIAPALRLHVGELLASEGLAGLVTRLEALNPAGLGGLDRNNPRRVTRALERCLATGQTLVELAQAFRGQPLPFADWRVEVVELVRKPEDLRARIHARTAAMLAGGLIDEVRRLRDAGFEANRPAASAVGYRETLRWLDAGDCDLQRLASEIEANTWRLVRKQRTWFRGQIPERRIVTLAPGENPCVEQLFGD